MSKELQNKLKQDKASIKISAWTFWKFYLVVFQLEKKHLKVSFYLIKSQKTFQKTWFRNISKQVNKLRMRWTTQFSSKNVVFTL